MWCLRSLAIVSVSGVLVLYGLGPACLLASPDSTPRRLVRDISRHHRLTSRVTAPRRAITVRIREGSTLFQIAATLEAAGILRAADFLAFASDASRAQRLTGEAAPSLEGYLFADTYEFYANSSPEHVARRMYARTVKQYAPFVERARQLGMSRMELLTLASIIEKEATRSDRHLVSAVFHNRLKIDMALESCATAIYAAGPRFTGRLRRVHLQSVNRYNTYVHKGLPPGPIAAPSASAIRAAVYPDYVEYLFFVLKDNGAHAFSRTRQEHDVLVRKYQGGPATATPTV